MSSSPVSPGKLFSRDQQGIILLLGIILVALWVWRSGLGGTPAPAPNPPQKIYFVQVLGAVARPGIYRFSHPPELRQIWTTAGGPDTPRSLNDPLASGSRITIAADGHYYLGRMSGADLLVLGLAIDLNRANPADLEAVPGIGPVLAGRIVKYRETYGPFTNIDALIKINGIGPKNLEQMRPYLEISANPLRAKTK